MMKCLECTITQVWDATLIHGSNCTGMLHLANGSALRAASTRLSALEYTDIKLLEVHYSKVKSM